MSFVGSCAIYFAGWKWRTANNRPKAAGEKNAYSTEFVLRLHRDALAKPLGGSSNKQS